MRKIEEAMTSAILARTPWAQANTAVTIHPMPDIDGRKPGGVLSGCGYTATRSQR